MFIYYQYANLLNCWTNKYRITTILFRIHELAHSRFFIDLFFVFPMA